MTRTALATGIILLFQASSTAVHAQDILELGNRCATEGSELLNRIGSPFSYNTHYSTKLNGFFARASFYEKLNDGSVQGTTYLYIVADGKIIGLLVNIGPRSYECRVEQVTCASVDEFDELIAPYLEL